MPRPPRSVWTGDVAPLRRAAVEHAMRLTDDDALVLPLRRCPPHSRTARVALARLAADAGTTPTSSSPLLVFCYGGELDPDWRDACPAVTSSLWSELELRAGLAGTPVGGDPYRLLQELRDAG